MSTGTHKAQTRVTEEELRRIFPLSCDSNELFILESDIGH